MKKMLTVSEYVGLVSEMLSSTLTRDFGDKPAHIVDLSTHAVTQVEAMFQFLYAYSGLKDE